MSALLDILGTAGYLADTPAAYFRGLLAGRFGERASGEEMLESWGGPFADRGPIAGIAAEVIADPVNLLGGARFLTQLARKGRIRELNARLGRGVGQGTLDIQDALARWQDEPRLSPLLAALGGHNALARTPWSSNEELS